MRTKQTAEILAEELKPQEVRENDALDPMADPRIWIDRLGASKEDIMLGHLPHLSRFAVHLLLGRDGEIIRLPAGGVICLERDEEGRWMILWAINTGIMGME